MDYKQLTEAIIGAMIEVHKELCTGLPANFNVLLLKNGIKRRVLGMEE